MITTVLQIDPDHLDRQLVEQAAEVLRRGGLVAFPTETVYGLGANALDADAVAKIFVAKGRPANNPLIVHVANESAARELVDGWPEVARRLARAFWPGPLTLVLPKKLAVPEIVTAGGPTVAIRVPAHPVAMALLEAAGIPIAAPSANRSTYISPTRAEHVLRGIDGRIDLIIDAGPTTGGLESTVLDLTAVPPKLLRPGLISLEALESIVGVVQRSRATDRVNVVEQFPEMGNLVESSPDQSTGNVNVVERSPDRSTGSTEGLPAPPEPLPSPGMMPRHYAPRASLECTFNDGWTQVARLAHRGKRVGWLRLSSTPHESLAGVDVIQMPTDAEAYAKQLYAVLHDLDAAGVENIVVELPPDQANWLAIRDRLRRASHP